MPDKYQDFAELSVDCRSGVDFWVNCRSVASSPFAVIAPHAGKIEKGTSEITKAIAGDAHSYYLFEGLRNTLNRELHITSHNFDEPKLLDLLGQSELALGIHGRQDDGDTDGIYIGGLDEVLIELLDGDLRANGFKTKTSGHRFPARDPRNVCNRGTSGKGAQLEFSKTMREQVRKDDAALEALVTPVRAALTERAKQS